MYLELLSKHMKEIFIPKKKKGKKLRMLAMVLDGKFHAIILKGHWIRSNKIKNKKNP